MSQFFALCLIGLTSQIAFAADEEKALRKPEMLEPPTIGGLLKQSSSHFSRSMTFYLINEQIVPASSDDLPEIPKKIMKLPGIFKNLHNGCKKRASDIKTLLDKSRVWNLLIYIGVTPRYQNTSQPFSLAGKRRWTHHWANLIATENPKTGVVALLVFDPVLFPRGPQPVEIWVNALVAGDQLAFLSKSEKPREPNENDLFLIIDDHF